jgi:hypothetical protein
MLNEVFVRIEADHISYGGACSKSELPEHFEKLRKILEDEDFEEPKAEKKKGFLSLKKK